MDNISVKTPTENDILSQIQQRVITMLKVGIWSGNAFDTVVFIGNLDSYLGN